MNTPPADHGFGTIDVTASLTSATTDADPVGDGGGFETSHAAVINDDFLPLRPQSLQQTGLTSNEMSPLLLRFLFLHGPQSGRLIADQVKLPFDVVEPLLTELKSDLLVSIKSASVVGDYVF
jgi:hypothetical protein